MKAVKYLFLCLMECLSLNVAFRKEFIFGAIQIILYFVAMLLSYFMLRASFGVAHFWASIYSILIMIAFIIVLYCLICIIELAYRLFFKLKRRKMDRKE